MAEHSEKPRSAETTAHHCQEVLHETIETIQVRAFVQNFDRELWQKFGATIMPQGNMFRYAPSITCGTRSRAGSAVPPCGADGEANDRRRYEAVTCR